MYEACLFDYGNTLIEFDLPQIRFIENKFSRKLSVRFGPVTEKELHDALDRLYKLPRQGPEPTYRELDPVDQMVILFNDLYGRDSRSREEMEEADAILQEVFLETITIAPEDRLLLQRLSDRLPLGLVSNYPSGRTIRKSLEKVGIENLFRVVVISGEIGYVKPHPSMFEAAMAGIPAAPDQILFVGDLWDADLCGARDAGLRTCHMVGFTSKPSFEDLYASYRPDHVAWSLREVAGILGVI